MADSAKLICGIRVANGTDYGSVDAEAIFLETEVTDATQTLDTTVRTTTGGLAVTLFQTTYAFVVHNLSSTIDVTLTYTDSDANAGAKVIKPLGMIAVKESDLGTSLTLTSDSGNPLCRVLAFGKDS
jgi:hypothetical protein